MASLRDSVKNYQDELRDGIAWVAFWKQGRSWNAELFHLEVDGTLEPFDRSRLEEIKAADPAAVILNGYYCGHLGEDMSLDELTAGVRYHYENGRNDLDGFIGAHDDRLPPEVIEEARAAAHAAGLPFSEKPYRDGEDFDPYIFDGSMSIEDYELMHRIIEKERSEQMDEWKTGYSSYDHDRLEAADKMKIERGIYFDTKGADISPLTALPLAELVKLREESAAAEQTVFENLKVQASAWEEQAGKTLLFDKAIEYARIPEVKHTANKWQDEDNDRHTISNRVYKMSYHVYENTRYDKAAQKSIPYSYTLSWNIYTNSPHGYGQAKIAGQDRKVFADRAAMEKYLNGRIKAYEKLFTEISPAIPPEYAEQFKVNGQLLPGYTVEGEEIKQPAADIPAAAPRTEPGQETEQFAILIDSRTRFETGEPGGYWLSMPATKEQLHEAMQSVGITADNPQDFFIHGYSDREDRHIALPYDMVCAAQVDELNFLAARLETLDASGIAALNAATQRRNGFENIGQLIDFTYNEDFFVHIPEVHTPRDLGDYYLNKSGMVQMPAEWKNSIDLIAFGRNAAAQEKGSFTEYGYLVESGDAWEKHFEGRDVPEDYRIMSYPQPTIELDAAPAVQTATISEVTPQEPRPVIPIVLTSEKPAEKLKEITDRLEQGITELFDSERYKEYLRVMSKFHNYSFNNTLLIAMQKPDASLVAGFGKWRDDFERHVKKGEKGIKILAPSPYKVKKQMEKIDPTTQKPVIGADGKIVTEEREIEIPVFRVVTVFDVSQTEGKEIPDIAVSELTGSVEQYQDFFAALEKASPVPIAFENIEGGAHGYYHLEEKWIAIDEGMSELQTLKTAIHEIAHAKLHAIDKDAPAIEQADRPDRRTREVQAESVAYAVCQHYGLDTSDYSFGYVAGWSSGRELSELKASLETIRKVANELITDIDGHLAQLQQEREAKQEAEQPQEEQTTDQTEAPSLDLTAEPVVTVLWSESPHLKEGQTMPLHEADALFAKLDAEYPAGMGYDKTKFRIDFTFRGQPDNYEGRQDFGDGDGSLIQHIQSYHEYYAQDENWKSHVIAETGLEGWEQDKAERDMLLGEFVPYMKLHCNLSHMEQEARRPLLSGEELTPEQTAYFHAVLDYVQECRPLLNQGQYRLPEPPKLSDFDQTLQDYKEQVQAEIAQEAAAAGMTVEEYAAAGYEAPEQDSFSIYQIKSGDETRDYRFEPFDRLQATGRSVDKANYDLVYTAPLDGKTTLEDIYRTFNIDHPADFKGHSLSVSDVVVLHQGGKDTAHYCDSFGFQQVPEFLRENPLRTAELSTEQNENMIDGVINNTPSMGELEAKAKAGEQISLTDLADAAKAEAKKPKAQQSRKAQQKKPSIRAQLKAAQAEQAKKKPAREKSQELEV